MTILYACADDGSSSCCCWASWEIAAVLLGLHDNEVSGESYAKTHKRSKKTRRKQACSSLTIAHLRRIMKRHGRVTVRNQASIFDSSCQDLVFSAKPDKAISSSDQDFFQSLILKACCSTLLVSFIGSHMCPTYLLILWYGITQARHAYHYTYRLYICMCVCVCIL